MPHFDAANRLTVEIVHEVSQLLPEFCLQSGVELDNTPLHCYLETYGFTSMSCYSSAKYSLGFLNTPSARVAAHTWFPKDPVGTVFVAHGLFDHVGLYLDLVDVLVGNEFAVVAIDFPGHGLSDGEKAVISDFSEYATVIEESLAILEKDLPGPVYAIGQSTGGAAILNYVLDRRGQVFSKLALLAPLIRPRGWVWVSFLHLLLHRFLRFVPRRFTLNSNRKDFNHFLDNNDPLQSRHISVEWIGAMKKWVNGFKNYDESNIPIVIYQGDSDMTVLWENNLPCIQAKFKNCQTHMINGAMHHLVNEGDAWRDPLFEGVIDFFKS